MKKATLSIAVLALLGRDTQSVKITKNIQAKELHADDFDATGDAQKFQNSSIAQKSQNFDAFKDPVPQQQMQQDDMRSLENLDKELDAVNNDFFNGSSQSNVQSKTKDVADETQEDEGV